MDDVLAKPVSIASQIHQRLRDEIVHAVLKPGMALSEADIAARYKVSRQPVREAFIRLAQEDLVEIRPQRGTYVRRIAAVSVLDAHFVRDAIEVAIAREAAQKAQPADLEKLYALIACQATASTNAEFLASDEALHEGIAAMAEHLSAWRVVHQIKAQMDRVRYLSYGEVSPIDRLVQQHREIVDAIAAHQPDAAAAAVLRHTADILHQLPELARRYPEMFEG